MSGSVSTVQGWAQKISQWLSSVKDTVKWDVLQSLSRGTDEDNNGSEEDLQYVRPMYR